MLEVRGAAAGAGLAVFDAASLRSAAAAAAALEKEQALASRSAKMKGWK